MSTSIANSLLRQIEDRTTGAEPMALVRALHDQPHKNAIVCVYHGELLGAVSDRKLADQMLAAVRTVTDRGAVADLVEAVDEEGSAVTLAVEIIRPKLELLIFGGGHVGQAVAVIGALTGYNVTVVDDREEFASRDRLPDRRIALLVSDYRTAANKVKISSNTAVVIVTRGHQYDELCLKNVIYSNASYIGMIGSRRRVLSVFKKLASEGFPEANLQKVHAPIGLSIGARTPQEIAVAILAEIINHTNNPRQGHKGE